MPQRNWAPTQVIFFFFHRRSQEFVLGHSAGFVEFSWGVPLPTAGGVRGSHRSANSSFNTYQKFTFRNPAKPELFWTNDRLAVRRKLQRMGQIMCVLILQVKKSSVSLVGMARRKVISGIYVQLIFPLFLLLVAISWVMLLYQSYQLYVYDH